MKEKEIKKILKKYNLAYNGTRSLGHFPARVYFTEDNGKGTTQSIRVNEFSEEAVIRKLKQGGIYE